MAGFFDIYVLSGDRSKATALRFLDRFVPARRALADAYPVPRHADPPDAEFMSAEDLLDYVERHPDAPHALYWASLAPGDPRYAMIFPTADGHTVYGLSAEENETELLADLMAFLNATSGYIDVENPPPDTAPDFEATVESYRRRG